MELCKMFRLWLVMLLPLTSGYVLIGPKILQTETYETFCVSLDGALTPANCTLQLTSLDRDAVYSTIDYRIKGLKDCFKIYVPSVKEHAARVVWKMRYDDANIPLVTTNKEIGIQKLNFINLIQTDKAWYTPGQTVQFRVLILNYLLQAVVEPINRIWIEDPTGTTVSQWVNLTSPRGLHQLELTLSTEPIQGVWRIRMERSGQSQTQKEFEVREYVLPKFEVNIVAPDVITYKEAGDQSTQKISINICAKYSYGQPVKGEWKANVTVINNTWSRYAASTKIHIDRKGSVNAETGCGILKLAATDLGIGDYDGFTQKTIEVIAAVIEQGTGIEMNSTWSTVVKQKSINVDLNTWSGTSFKNGLPFYGIAKISNADGQAINEKMVEMCVQPSYDQSANGNKPIKARARHPGKRVGERKPSFVHCAIRKTDSNGIADFTLFPSEPDLTEFTVKARVLGPNPNSSLGESQITIRKSFSPSGSFLVFVPPQNYPQPAVCRSALQLKLLFNTDKEINLDVHYMVIGRGDVLSTGIKQVKFREEDNIDLTLGDSLLNKKRDDEDSELDEPTVKLIGELELEIEVLPEFSPKVSVLAYYVRPDREVVTANIEIPVQNCFPNPVKMHWAAKRKQPGKSVNLHVKSGPGSLCGYSVVDQSVTYIRPELHLSESNVYNVLPMYHINPGAWPQQVTPQYEYCHKHETEPDSWFDDLRRKKRSFIPWGFGPQLKDAMDAFDQAGAFIMTDLKVETRPCVDSGPRFMKYRARFLRPEGELLARTMGLPDVMMMQRVPEASMDVQLSENYKADVHIPSGDTVRSYFPETWLWSLVTLNDQGESKINVELPHTITTWSGRALCVSETSGFGLSPVAEVQAFQPFFIEIHLPYSVKRTEKSEVKVTAFNYATHDLPIRLTLAYSEQYELLSDSDSVQICLPARESVTHLFLISATELGTHNLTITAMIDDTYEGTCGEELLTSASDTVIKELLVIPEGFPIEQVFSHMACPKEFEEDMTVEWALRLPEDLVEGSARAWVTAVGDLMGPALQGLTGLVRMPMGCGEQNMVLFTPIIYVMEYLTSTRQLDPALKEKATNFMKSGYQRELTYRHSDGSYSAFGKSDAEGSLWLTAFVVKSFAAARKFIHIDEAELQSSIRWLQMKQLENGCFPVIGTVLHKELKGGIADSDDNLATLTAFTLVSLLESLESIENDLIVDKILLRKKLLDSLPCIEFEEPESLGFYGTALTAYAMALIGKTDGARKRIDWLLTQAKTDESLLWWEKPGSGRALSVETTSYVLLTLTRLANKDDLIKSRSIVRWLSQQRNSEGGFVSTQDTVVALQAISAYATLIGTEETDLKLVISAGEGEFYAHIREHDRMVQRRFDLPAPLPSTVKVENIGDGQGCAILQATLRYNVKTSSQQSAFELSVSTRKVLHEGLCDSHELKICTQYKGSQNESSNMALIEVDFISGHEVDKETIKKRNRHPELKRFEVNKEKLVLYFDQISKDPLCVSIISRQVFKVNDAKEANVRIFDYYQPDQSQAVSYGLDNSDECVILREEEAPVKRSSGNLINEEVELFQPAQPIVAEFAEFMAERSADESDLELPEGVEGPIPTYAAPDQERGCPVCYTDAPNDLQKLYCQAKTAYWAETRPNKRHRVRLTSEITHSLAVAEKRNISIDFSFDETCQCDVLEGNEPKGITVFGLPQSPYPAPPVKLSIGPEVVLIGKTPKQLNARSMRAKCNLTKKSPKPSRL